MTQPGSSSGWSLTRGDQGRVVAPPGIPLYVATAFAILIAIDANSRSSFTGFLLTAAVWFVLACIWTIRFVAAAVAARSRPRLPAAYWIRWLAIPIVMGSVFLVTRTEALFDARLALSRPALNQMAVEVMAGGPLARGWVGLYDVGDVDRLDNGLRFVIDDIGLSRHGFAYASSGEPAQSTKEDFGLWTDAWYEPLGDGWWLWTEAWD